MCHVRQQRLTVDCYTQVNPPNLLSRVSMTTASGGMEAAFGEFLKANPVFETTRLRAVLSTIRRPMPVSSRARVSSLRFLGLPAAAPPKRVSAKLRTVSWKRSAGAMPSALNCCPAIAGYPIMGAGVRPTPRASRTAPMLVKPTTAAGRTGTASVTITSPHSTSPWT